MKELERENAELKQQITLLSGVFSREEELQSHITELKRIIAESKEQKPIAWMTNESKNRLKHGGNVNGTVPIHTEKSNSSSIPLYELPIISNNIACLGNGNNLGSSLFNMLVQEVINKSKDTK